MIENYAIFCVKGQKLQLFPVKISKKKSQFELFFRQFYIFCNFLSHCARNSVIIKI